MKRLGVVLAGFAVLFSACGRDDVEDLGVQRTHIPTGEGRPLFARLSPDGTRLAYSKPVEGMAAIFIANVDGSNPVRLTHGVWDVNPVWSPDGQWIAYHAEDPDHDLWVVSASGGEPRALTASRTDDVPATWLPDGSAVVFLQQGAGDTRTMVAPLDGGPIRQLGQPMDGNVYVTPSPDGRWLALDVRLGGRSTIWVQETAGGAARQLTTEGFEELPWVRAWSPDSRSLVYTSRRNGTTDLWIVEVETGEVRQLTQDVRDDFGAVWSPDGSRIAFLSRRGGQVDVWIVSAAGGQPRRITADRAMESDLQWSPDGQSILFHRAENSAGVHVIPASGGSSRVLFSWPQTNMANLHLSPDGRTLVFQSNRSGVPDIWTVPLSGGEPTAIANSPVNDVQPRWSPDGSSIAFMSTRAGTPDIWVTSTTGGEPRRLTDWPSAETWPVWSPDGNTIAFTSNREAGRMEVWTIPAGGGEATRLTHTGAAARDLHWSPDGREIFYVGATASGLHGIFSVPVGGGTPRSLGVDVRIAVTDLSSDGQYISYGALNEGWSILHIVSVAGGTAQQLTPRSERVYQPYAGWSPDGMRLVVMDYDYAVDHMDLYVVNRSDGQWRRLTQTADATETFPLWTPDGQSIVFMHQEQQAEVVSVNVAGVIAELSRD
jgi:Tol biopolymer transport system component